MTCSISHWKTASAGFQRRLTRLLPTFSGTWPPQLTIATEWPRADQGGVADIKQWITSVATPRLIIIDTLAQFRKISNGKAPIYTDDYAAISDLQKLASEHNVGVLIVHHDRKSEADDVFDTVSGSLGLTGAADTILIMKRQAGTVTLHVRGRHGRQGAGVGLSARDRRLVGARGEAIVASYEWSGTASQWWCRPTLMHCGRPRTAAIARLPERRPTKEFPRRRALWSRGRSRRRTSKSDADRGGR